MEPDDGQHLRLQFSLCTLTSDAQDGICEQQACKGEGSAVMVIFLFRVLSLHPQCPIGMLLVLRACVPQCNCSLTTASVQV